MTVLKSESLSSCLIFVNIHDLLSNTMYSNDLPLVKSLINFNFKKLNILSTSHLSISNIFFVLF